MTGVMGHVTLTCLFRRPLGWASFLQLPIVVCQIFTLVPARIIANETFVSCLLTLCDDILQGLHVV
jgi:hypothetical protein